MGRHGENIRKRKDGRWEARVISSYKPDGKAIYRSCTENLFGSQGKRNDLLWSTAAISSRCEKQAAAKEKSPLEEVAWEWLAARKDSIKESTYAHYTTWSGYLLPCLGPRRLYALTPEVLDGFLRKAAHRQGRWQRRLFPKDRGGHSLRPSTDFALCAAPSISLRRTARKSIFQDITQVIVIKQTIEHDF